jgi:hypothetical protein
MGVCAAYVDAATTPLLADAMSFGFHDGDAALNRSYLIKR